MSSEERVTASSTVSSLVRNIHRSRKAFTNKRLIFKNGEFNISQKGIRKRKRQYLADIFTTLIDLKWRWSLVLFMATFLITWLFFGLIWWMIAHFKGDISNFGSLEWTACVENIDGFIAALLFSIETQQTIGYGGRSITKNCPEAIVVLMLQATFGVIIQALMTGLIFAKLARPHKRAQTLMFSKTACICMRNKAMVLLFRVGDMRSSNIIGAHMDALLIRRKVTEEGEVIPLGTENIDLGFANNRLLLRWPVIIEHKIDENSPFWALSKGDLERENFEILVILEGSVPSTGASTQAMTSYLPQEISWGHRFERLITQQREDGKYLFDYQRYHATIPVDTPPHSARELSQKPDQTNSIHHRKVNMKSCSAISEEAHDAVKQWMNADETSEHFDISDRYMVHRSLTVQTLQSMDWNYNQARDDDLAQSFSPSAPSRSPSLVRMSCSNTQTTRPNTPNLNSRSEQRKGHATAGNGYLNGGFLSTEGVLGSSISSGPPHGAQRCGEFIIELGD